VELLVVISVISLLMGILLPALGKARAAGLRTYCTSNLRQIGVAFRAYLDDNRDIMPPACAYPWDITDTTNPDYRPPITKFLSPLLKVPKVFICRADTVKYYSRTGNTSYYYNGRQQRGPRWTDGVGGTAVAASDLAKSGIKEKNIDVMSDFDAIHSGMSGIWTNRVGRKNYLYADWHVSDYKNQD
jgi:prepilin-type processing-associated H-X9-DG protein